MVRVLKVIDNQVRALRKRQIIAAFKSSPGEADHRNGVYVGIRSEVADYRLEDAMPPIPKLPMSSPDYLPALRLSATPNSKD
jgi:hypothetical protein